MGNNNIELNTKNDWTLWIIIPLMFVFSGSALMVGQWKIILLLVVGFVIVFAGTLRKRLGDFLSISSFFLVYFMIMAALNYVLHAGENSLNRYIGYMLVIYAAYLFSYSLTWEKFVKVFVIAMLILVIIALIGYYIVPKSFWSRFILIQSKRPNGDIYNNIFSAILYNSSVWSQRNIGFFWEPGVFSTFIILALVFTPKVFKGWLKWLAFLVFTIGVYSTQSTAGYVLYLAVILYLFSLKINKESKNYIFYVIILIALCLAAVLVYYFLDDIIYGLNLEGKSTFAKLLKVNLYKNPRIIAIKSNLQMFAEFPIFGTGFAKGDLLAKEIDCYDTATPFRFISCFGVFGFAYFAMLIIGVFRIKDLSSISKVFLFLILFAINIKEPQDGFIIIWMILFYMVKGTSFTANRDISNAVIEGEKGVAYE